MTLCATFHAQGIVAWHHTTFTRGLCRNCNDTLPELMHATAKSAGALVDEAARKASAEGQAEVTTNVRPSNGNGASGIFEFRAQIKRHGVSIVHKTCRGIRRDISSTSPQACQDSVDEIAHHLLASPCTRKCWRYASDSAGNNDAGGTKAKSNHSGQRFLWRICGRGEASPSCMDKVSQMILHEFKFSRIEELDLVLRA